VQPVQALKQMSSSIQGPVIANHELHLSYLLEGKGPKKLEESEFTKKRGERFNKGAISANNLS